MDPQRLALSPVPCLGFADAYAYHYRSPQADAC